MDIADDQEIKPDIRQASLAQLKNNIDKRWKKTKSVTAKNNSYLG
jgi:hypothetical protein